ncbi:MAG: hypothetical protein AB2L24_27450 [Mangrovibacterium sp.]
MSSATLINVEVNRKTFIDKNKAIGSGVKGKVQWYRRRQDKIHR